MFLSLLPTLFFAAHAVRAANDWSTSCLSGQCSYDVQNGTANGTLTLTGHQHALSDITPAAGWTILDCNPNAVEQNIRLVCTGNEQDCDHMYQGEPVNTIVRLPENCGKMPFARIASEWQHENQTIPDHVMAAMPRHKRSRSTVRGLALDTNWRAATPSHDKTVSFQIEGANLPTQPVSTTDVTKRWSSSKQGLSINVDKSFTLLDQTISCPAVDDFPALQEHTRMSVDAKAQAQIGYSMSASGSLFPPGVKGVTMSTTLDATMNGVLNIDATASATFDTGRVNIFSFPLAGLDFPHILTLGPTFFVDVQGTAGLQAQMNMNVDLAYSISGAKLSFPSSQDSTLGYASPADTNLQLSAGTSGNMEATLTAHVIPGVKFGLSALSIASADVTLDVDASATLDMKLSGSAAATPSSSKSTLSSTLAIPSSSKGSISSSSTAITSSSPKSSISSTIPASASSTALSSSSVPVSSTTSTRATESSSSFLYSTASTTSSLTTSLTPSAPSASAANTTIPVGLPVNGSGSTPSIGSNSGTHTPGSGTTFGVIAESSVSAPTGTSIYSSATASSVISYITPSTTLDITSSSVSASSTVVSSGNSSSATVASATASTSTLPVYTSEHSGAGCNHTAAPTPSNTAPILITRTVTGVETVTSLETLTTVETIRSVEAETSIQVITLSNPAAATPAPTGLYRRTDSSTFNGCVNLSSGLAIKVGADGSFFGLFDKSASVTLFSKSFKLFEKCFGDGTPGATPARRWIRPLGFGHRLGRKHPRHIVKRGNPLTCVPGVSGLLSSVINELVPSDQITALD